MKLSFWARKFLARLFDKRSLRPGYVQPEVHSTANRLTASQTPGAVDLIISPNEISFAHGTGVLLSRMLEEHNSYIVMRSHTHYGGKQRISARDAFVLPEQIKDRRAIFAQLNGWLAQYEVRSILCVPYFETDLKMAIAAEALTGAPLGLWIMDDNCIHNTGIARNIMMEAIDRATALFAISPELKRTYQSEFRKAMTVVPPLVAPTMIRSQASLPAANQRLVMIGNLWSAKILDRVSKVIKEAGLTIEWLSANPDLWAQSIDLKKIAKRGVKIIDGTDLETTRVSLETAACVLVPSDPGDTGPHETSLGAMSLPTRVPFIIASAGTPIIVMSQPATAVANFVNGLNIGMVVPFDGVELKAALVALSAHDEQFRIRNKCMELAPQFSFSGASRFIFETIQNNGRWLTDRYEKLVHADKSVFGIFQDKPVPAAFRKDFSEIVNLGDRLKFLGFEPDFVLDIGASTAIWSNALHAVFDKSRYILCDPLFSRYANIWSLPGFELVEAAIGNKNGQTTFSVSTDLYGSSMIRVSDVATVAEQIMVPLRTVDEISKEKCLKGRGILKVDVQYAEHLVIEGALETLEFSIDVVILELTLVRAHADAKPLLEVANRMDELGFRIFDQVGGWRVPATGEMEQLDVVFVKKESKLFMQGT